jgi:hypothetical protein
MIRDYVRRRIYHAVPVVCLPLQSGGRGEIKIDVAASAGNGGPDDPPGAAVRARRCTAFTISIEPGTD